MVWFQAAFRNGGKHAVVHGELSEQEGDIGINFVEAWNEVFSVGKPADSSEG